MDIIKLENGKYAKPCYKCGKIQTYLRKNYAKESFRLKKMCKSCSNKITKNCHRGLYNDIRISWFNKFKVSAETRNIEFNIDIEYIWQIYLKQNKKCALSKIDIGWNQTGEVHTASIDMSNSTKGYIVDNVLLIYKDINFMKQSFTQEHFIYLCKEIAKNT